MNMPYQQPMMNYTPNYGAYQYNPMASYQRYQQPEPTQGISGRVVQAVETINPNEVPMDGSMAFFPKQDMSEIYVKGWNADGTINTIVYKPYTAPKDNQAVNSMANTENAKFTLSDESTQLFLNKFEELSEKIGQLEDRFDKSLGTQRKTSRTQSMSIVMARFLSVAVRMARNVYANG